MTVVPNTFPVGSTTASLHPVRNLSLIHICARNEHAASDGLHNAYAISIMGGILLGIIGSFATPSMLRLMNTPDEIMQDSVIYLRIYFAGIIFVFLYNMGSSILRLSLIHI